jgi:hypothetical protein
MIEKTVALLSYPRSGSNWLRYIIEVVYKKPTQTPHFADGTTQGGMNGPLTKLLNSQIKLNKSYSPVIHTHDIGDKGDAQDIIFTIRNYKEFGAGFEGANIERYIRILKSFEQFCWHGNPNYPDNNPREPEKLLIRYEDLIDEEKIKSIFAKLNVFFEVKYEKYEKDIDDFIKNLKGHRKTSIHTYETYNIKTLTKGRDPLFHSKQSLQADLKKIDEQVKSKNPALFEKYLKIYEEPN